MRDDPERIAATAKLDRLDTGLLWLEDHFKAAHAALNEAAGRRDVIAQALDDAESVVAMRAQNVEMLEELRYAIEAQANPIRPPAENEPPVFSPYPDVPL